MMMNQPTTRRYFLTALGVGATAGLAGCTDEDIPADAVRTLPAPSKGDDNAPVVLKVFEDFACPHCKQFNEKIEPRIISNYVSTGDVRYEWYDYPLPVSNWSWPAAMSASAVQDYATSEDVFWKYKQELFKNTDSLSYRLFQKTATKLGLDGEEIVSDTRDNRYHPVVEADVAHGDDFGISGTPGVVVNGELVEPTENQSYYEAITASIDAHLQS